MSVNFSNLGFNTCVFDRNTRNKTTLSNADLLSSIKEYLQVIKIDFILTQESNELGKIAKLSLHDDDKNPFHFFIFRTKETDLETIKIVPETDSLNWNKLSNNFSVKLHEALQGIAKTIHIKTGADCSFSIHPNHFPKTQETALEDLRNSRYAIIGQDLACPVVAKMETLDDGSVEVVANDNPSVKKNPKAISANLSTWVIDALQYLKNNFKELKSVLSIQP